MNLDTCQKMVGASLIGTSLVLIGCGYGPRITETNLFEIAQVKIAAQLTTGAWLNHLAVQLWNTRGLNSPLGLPPFALGIILLATGYYKTSLMLDPHQEPNEMQKNATACAAEPLKKLFHQTGICYRSVMVPERWARMEEDEMAVCGRNPLIEAVNTYQFACNSSAAISRKEGMKAAALSKELSEACAIKLVRV